MPKIVEIRLAILSRIRAKLCVTLCLNMVCREGLRMIVLVSLIVLLKGFPCFDDFRMVHLIPIHLYSLIFATYFLWFAITYA